MISRLKLMLGMGTKHEKTGLVLYSEYFKRYIQVTAYIDNENWKFQFFTNTTAGNFVAGTPFDYFVEQEKGAIKKNTQ